MKVRPAEILLIRLQHQYNGTVVKCLCWLRMRKKETLLNHYVHPGYDKMRTHRCRSVQVSFAVGLVVFIFLQYFSAFCSCLSR